jgi:hypothetical protein
MKFEFVNKEFLIEQYTVQQKPVHEIVKEFNIPKGVVWYRLKQNDIKSFASILKEYFQNREELNKTNNVLWDISNGRTLCQKCHFETDSYGRADDPYGDN